MEKRQLFTTKKSAGHATARPAEGEIDSLLEGLEGLGAKPLPLLST